MIALDFKIKLLQNRLKIAVGKIEIPIMHNIGIYCT